MRIEERIGARVREERRRKGWSQEELGQQIGEYLARPWSPQTVSQAEKGGRDFAAEDMLVLALVFGVPVQSFYRQAMEALEEIQVPSGYTISEASMRRVYGLENKEALRLAREFQKLVDQIPLLGEGEQS